MLMTGVSCALGAAVYLLFGTTIVISYRDNKVIFTCRSGLDLPLIEVAVVVVIIV
jgi:hypothetical protein